MSLFVWDAKYSVDIHEIDRQHKRLFALFNELYEAMQEGHADDIIDKILTRAMDYTAYHFQTEEKLFDQYGYHDQATHRAEHAQLTEQVKTLMGKLKAGDVHVSLATLKLLSDWLNQHILGSDQKYAPFLLANGVR